jgi:maltose-binding protein MalE
MKTTDFFIILIILLGLGLASCSSTSKTTTKNQVQIQKQETDQQNTQKRMERAGLTSDEIKKLNDYAERKAQLACKLDKLDKKNSQELSEAAKQDMKEDIIALDDQLTVLGQEIDVFCNNEDRINYFMHAYNKRYLACK